MAWSGRRGEAGGWRGRREEEGGGDVAGTGVEGPGGKALMTLGFPPPKIQIEQGAAAARRLVELLICCHADRRLLEPSIHEGLAPGAFGTA